MSTERVVKFRPKITELDLTAKARKVTQWLSDGDRVRVIVMLRGREVQHPELGRHLCYRLVGMVGSVDQIESRPKMDGRNMTMILGSAPPDARVPAITGPAS